MSNFYKRTVSVILVFVLCFGMVIPAYAADEDQGMIDMLSIFGDEVFAFNPASDSFLWSVDMPYSLYRYVDILVFSNQTITRAYAGSSSNTLNVQDIGDGFYRVYGNCVLAGYKFDIGFGFVRTCTGFNIISCKASKLTRTDFPLKGSWNGYTSGNTFWSGTFDGINSSVINQEVAGSAAYANYTYDYSLSFYPGITDDWKKFDSISLNFAFTGYAVNSITAYIDGINVLDSISFLDNGSYTDLRYNINNQYYFESSNDIRYVNLVLDLSDINKDQASYPVITITGSYEPSFTPDQSLITIGVCKGIIYEVLDTDALWYKRIWNSITTGFTNIVDKVELFRTNIFTLFASLQTNLSTWITDLGNYLGVLLNTLNNNIISGFTNIGNKLNDLITGSEEANSNSSNFNDDIDNQTNELEDLTGDLNSVTRPPLSDVDLSTSGMVDQSVVILATNGIGSVLSNQIILRVLIMALTFALAGFILFGKR